MKTKDEILKEAQDHFGVNVFSNDDGISRRIEHYAMDLWAQEVVKNNLVQADVIKSVCPVCKCIAGTTCAHSWHYDNKGNWR